MDEQREPITELMAEHSKPLLYMLHWISVRGKSEGGPELNGDGGGLTSG